MHLVILGPGPSKGQRMRFFAHNLDPVNLDPARTHTGIKPQIGQPTERLEACNILVPLAIRCGLEMNLLVLPSIRRLIGRPEKAGNRTGCTPHPDMHRDGSARQIHGTMQERVFPLGLDRHPSRFCINNTFMFRNPALGPVREIPTVEWSFLHGAWNGIDRFHRRRRANSEEEQTTGHPNADADS